MKKQLARKLILPICLTLAGAVAGWLYYRFTGCASGSCAITSDPVLSTIFGGVFGFLLSVIFEKPKEKKDD